MPAFQHAMKQDHELSHQENATDTTQQVTNGADEAAAKRFRKRSIVKAVIFTITALLLFLLLRATPLQHLLEPAWVDSHIKGLGSLGVLLFVLLGALFTGVGGPRQIVAFLSGYAYGVVGGTFLALFAVCLGCIASFSYARCLGRGFVQRRLGARLKRVDEIFSKSTVSTTLLLRFFPFSNNLATNLMAGVSNARLRWFLAGSVLGYLPQTLLFTLLGSGIRLGAEWQVGLSIALFVGSLVLGYVLFRRHWRLYRTTQDEI